MVENNTSQTWKEWLEENDGSILAKHLTNLHEKIWEPSPVDQQCAWEFLVELSTRVTLQPLNYRSGTESEALDSIRDLFQSTRRLIASHGIECEHFGRLAEVTLNEVIRKFTGHWRQIQSSGRLEFQDERRLFRRSLFELQQRLRKVVSIFESLAGVDTLSLSGESPRVPGSGLDLMQIWPNSFAGPKTSPEVLNQELLAIQRRRKARYIDENEREWGGLGKADNKDTSAGLIGLSISGGGIRSSTFGLGVLQALAEKGILKDIDYLSTVSGGGYAGAFISSAMLDLANEKSVDDLLDVQRGETETEQVRWIRNRSKYLLGDGLRATALEVGINLLRTLLAPIGILAAGLAICLVGSYTDWAVVICTISIMLATIALIACLLTCVDVNSLSLHRLYKERLSNAYIRSSTKTEIPKLSDLAESPKAPFHLICCAVNLPGSRNLELRGRRSDFFVFSPHHCGSVLTGYQETKKLENAHTQLDLATAMAISGAAVSTHMGTLPPYSLLRPLIMIFRLGYWLPNPAKIESTSNWWGPKFGKLFLEAAGSFDENDDYINVSDGGHIENLGVYELLRRRCKFIICIDGECDPKQTSAGFLKACRFASIDLGVRIEIDLSELRAGENGLSQSHFAFGTIHYDGADSTYEEIGYILYLKLSMTGNERHYVQEYKTRYSDFPHQSTLDQFYDEDQFEAYRALGYHVGKDVFQEELVGQLPAMQFRTREWLSQLVESLIEL